MTKKRLKKKKKSEYTSSLEIGNSYRFKAKISFTKTCKRSTKFHLTSVSIFSLTLQFKNAMFLETWEFYPTTKKYLVSSD